MKEFVNRNGKHIVYGIALIVTVTIIFASRYSYATENTNNQIYTRDELSSYVESLDNRVTNLESDSEIASEFLKSYPVGSIYISVNATNPGTTYGGTWVAWGNGQVPVGVDTSQTEFNVVEKTGGIKYPTLTIDQMPSHGHNIGAADSGQDPNNNWNLMIYGQYGNYFSGGIVSTTSGGYWIGSHATGYVKATGGSQPFNNLQPYITCHMWKRIA